MCGDTANSKTKHKHLPSLKTQGPQAHHTPATCDPGGWLQLSDLLHVCKEGRVIRSSQDRCEEQKGSRGKASRSELGPREGL